MTIMDKSLDQYLDLDLDLGVGLDELLCDWNSGWKSWSLGTVSARGDGVLAGYVRPVRNSRRRTSCLWAPGPDGTRRPPTFLSIMVWVCCLSLTKRR